MSITEQYGGSSLAMIGKDSIVIAADKRFGCKSATLHSNFTRIFVLAPKIVISLSGFVPDCQMILKELRKHINMFVFGQGRDIEPKEVCSLLSYILYSKRFMPYYISPIIAGFDSEGKGHLYTMDCIGCVDSPTDFTACGTAAQNLEGISEALYDKDLEEEDLFVTAVQAFLNGVDRDALSGWGADTILLTPTKRVYREVLGRQD